MSESKELKNVCLGRIFSFSLEVIKMKLLFGLKTFSLNQDELEDVC